MPIFFILLAAVLWGTTGTAQIFTPDNTHPFALGAIRLVIGGGSLLLVVILTGQFNLKNWPVRAMLIASASMACYQPLFFSAVQITGVAIGTVVAIGSAPILAGLLELGILKRKQSKMWWVATFLSVIGCILLFSNQGKVYIDPKGIALALGAGLTFATYTLVNKQLLEHHPPLTVVAVVFTLSAIMLSPMLLMFDLSWLLQTNGIAVSLHLGIFATSIAYILFLKGLMSVPSSTAVTLSLGEPLTAALLGVFVVGERLSNMSWVGIGLIGVGILLLALRTREKNQQQTIEVSL
ncbi:EamA family transporter [Bacillus solimangrovi]|uniref:Transporter n=1 Tax=Bacillus solimangrovi TaxID=1305675 RepID=A0A1E5LGT1_9BACI|nr:EamA family transporter [Bacillus solimangrovi]OEH93274.1 transporter [Bacillus solimangrovi]